MNNKSSNRYVKAVTSYYTYLGRKYTSYALLYKIDKSTLDLFHFGWLYVFATFFNGKRTTFL